MKSVRQSKSANNRRATLPLASRTSKQAGNCYAWSPFRAITPRRSRMGYALADREMRSVEQVRSAIVRQAGLHAG
jgi:hypothetical protein